MVGLESHKEYLNHHGREHTLLPGPATITEKGVEQGQVIGLFFTEGSDTWTGNMELDWSRVGGVEMTITEVEDVIKYVVEVVEMPRWSTMNYKPSCSKLWDPSDRIYGKYEMYDQYMGKGDGKRRGGQSMSTVRGMIDRVEGGGEESKEEIKIGVSKKLPNRKVEPGLRSVEGGGYSPQVSGKVRKFVTMYETKMQMKNRNISAGKKSENIQSYFSVCGPMKRKFDISSPVKWLDMGKYGEIWGIFEPCE